MVKLASKTQQENTQEKPTTNTRDQQLREAAERVYRHYGNDLDAFRRDIQRELVKRER